MKRSNDLVVGSVVLLALAIIIAATLWLKQADIGRTRHDFDARVRDAGGLQVGNPLVIRGVHSGRVDRIELGRDGWVHVRFTLDQGVELPPDPVVVLSSVSLFGEWQGEVMRRSNAPRDADVQRQLAEASGTAAVPTATLPDIAKLTAITAGIAGNVATVADRVHLAFDDSAARELRRSIRNTAELTGSLSRTARRQSTNLDSLAVDVRQAARALDATAASLQRTIVRVDSSTSAGQIARIVANADSASATLRASAEDLRAMSRELARSQSVLQSLLARGDSVASKLNAGQGSLGALLNDPSLYRNSDSLVVALRDLVADIRKNPKKYVNVRIF
jgi:phospholipid/cholesterol/gamma-HCH transport system substrate-binding protein